jgi:hypothetical protein
MMRLGHFKSVHVRSRPSLLIRTTLIARKKFVDNTLSIEQTIRGLLKVYGLKVGALHRCTFAAKVDALLADAPELRGAIGPLLEAGNLMRKQNWIGGCNRWRELTLSVSALMTIRASALLSACHSRLRSTIPTDSRIQKLLPRI